MPAIFDPLKSTSNWPSAPKHFTPVCKSPLLFAIRNPTLNYTSSLNQSSPDTNHRSFDGQLINVTSSKTTPCSTCSAKRLQTDFRSWKLPRRRNDGRDLRHPRWSPPWSRPTTVVGKVPTLSSSRCPRPSRSRQASGLGHGSSTDVPESAHTIDPRNLKFWLENKENEEEAQQDLRPLLAAECLDRLLHRNRPGHATETVMTMVQGWASSRSQDRVQWFRIPHS